jgi:hypothetical protein
MVLSDRDIKREMAAGRIVVTPLDEKDIQPASVDVRLGSNFRIFKNSSHAFIDPTQRQEGLTESIDVPAGETFVLHPGQFALGTTLERIAVADDILGKLEGNAKKGGYAYIDLNPDHYPSELLGLLGPQIGAVLQQSPFDHFESINESTTHNRSTLVLVNDKMNSLAYLLGIADPTTK